MFKNKTTRWSDSVVVTFASKKQIKCSKCPNRRPPKIQLRRCQHPGLKSGHFEIAVAIGFERFAHDVDETIDVGWGRKAHRSDLKVRRRRCNTLAL